MISQNLRRRHLTESQRANLGADIEPRFAEIAKAKQIEHGGTAPGRKAEESLVAKLPQVISEDGTDTQPETEPEQPKKPAPKARDLAAAAVGASPRYVQEAKRLKSEEPGLYAKVKAGEMSIPEAHGKKDEKGKKGKKGKGFVSGGRFGRGNC